MVVVGIFMDYYLEWFLLENTSSPCETSLHMPMCIGFFDCFVESKI
jgi:hypothetical protein